MWRIPVPRTRFLARLHAVTVALVDSTRAWTIAAAGALASGTAFGTAYTFGAFFDAMADDLDASRGSTALMFGVTLFLFFGLGVVSGPLADRFGPRRLMLVGAVLLSVGLALTSRVDSVYQGYATYGLGVGLGGGLVVTPMYVVAGGWFQRRRAWPWASSPPATAWARSSSCRWPSA